MWCGRWGCRCCQDAVAGWGPRRTCAGVRSPYTWCRHAEHATCRTSGPRGPPATRCPALALPLLGRPETPPVKVSVSGAVGERGAAQGRRADLPAEARRSVARQLGAAGPCPASGSPLESIAGLRAWCPRPYVITPHRCQGGGNCLGPLALGDGKTSTVTYVLLLARGRRSRSAGEALSLLLKGQATSTGPTRTTSPRTSNQSASASRSLSLSLASCAHILLYGREHAFFRGLGSSGERRSTLGRSTRPSAAIFPTSVSKRATRRQLRRAPTWTCNDGRGWSTAAQLPT